MPRSWIDRFALFELQLINDVKRQPRDRGQLPSQGRFPAACIPKHRHSFHSLSQYHATKRSAARGLFREIGPRDEEVHATLRSRHLRPAHHAQGSGSRPGRPVERKEHSTLRRNRLRRIHLVAQHELLDLAGGRLRNRPEHHGLRGLEARHMATTKRDDLGLGGPRIVL